MKLNQRNRVGRMRGAQAGGKQNPAERGAALIITLILLLLLGAASVATVALVSSDTMINGFYKNYRGSFYAADSGGTAVVEAMKNTILTDAIQTANPPLPVGSAAIPNANVWALAANGNGSGAYPPNLTNAYTQFQNSFFSIGDPGSWQGQFQLQAANPGGQLLLGVPMFTVEVNPNDSHSCLPMTQATCNTPKGIVNNTYDYNWTFTYPYTITVQGKSYGNENETITQSGYIVYNSTSGNAAAGGPPSFSKWGAFINQFSDCQGPLVPGTMNGPFFTNGEWNFGNFTNPGYTFNGSIQQSTGTVSWWKNNSCTDTTSNSNTIAPPGGFTSPNFEKGFQVNMPPVIPPSNTYSQAQAVLDAKGDPPCTMPPCAVDPPPTQTQLSNALKTFNGTPYPSSGSAPNGVYLPWYINAQGKKVYGSDPSKGGDGAGGGIYINGNVSSMTLSATTGGDGTSNPTQTYTITQGGTTTTIVVDNVAGTTTLVSGGTTLSLQGVPTQLDPTTGQPITQTDPSGNVVNPTMVYVNGQVQGLSGTVQNDVGITIAAPSDVSITGDITYKSAPVSIPADTLNATTDAGVLGIYTQGNIDLYPNSSGSNQGNLTVNASLAALSGAASNPNSGFETPGGGINTWTILGGRAEDHAHSVNVSAGNTYYDQRFANNFGPPWFPTAVPQVGAAGNPSLQSVSVSRTYWKESSR